MHMLSTFDFTRVFNGLYSLTGAFKLFCGIQVAPPLTAMTWRLYGG